MRRKKIRILSGIIVLMFLILSSGCSAKPQPEDVIKKFETAYNTSNIDMMIECCEPSVQKMYKGMTEIGGKLFGIDLATIISGMGGFTDIFGDEYGYGVANIKMIINSKEVVSESKVKFNVTQQFFYRNSNIPPNAPDQTNMNIYVVKIDEEWYISAKNY